MMSVGDFNVSFGTNDSIRLTIFHEQKFDLKIKNKQTETTTRYRTIIDDVLFILLHIYLLVFFNHTFFHCYMNICHNTTT